MNGPDTAFLWCPKNVPGADPLCQVTREWFAALGASPAKQGGWGAKSDGCTGNHKKEGILT